MGDNKVKSSTGIELTRDQEEFLQEVDAEEERIRREIFSTGAEARRAELLNRYYPPEYFRSPPSGHLVACWVDSRDKLRAAENLAEKQFWAYQIRGYAAEMSRRLSQHPISRYVLNTIHGCQDYYKKLLEFATKNMPENTQETDDLWKNSNYRVGRVTAKKRKEAVQKKSLVRGVFNEKVGILFPEYAVITAACDGGFDHFPNEVKEVLI